MNSFIKLITSNNSFAFGYIAILFFVGYMAIFENAGTIWVSAGWILFSILGVIITITAYTSLIQAFESRSWPQHEARLLNANVRHGRASGNRLIYSPEVEYEFIFEGKPCKGYQIDFSAMSSTETWAQEVINKISANGNKIMVHVNPLDPEVSVIFPGIRFVHILRFIVGPAMTIAGILFCLEIIKP